MEGMCLDHFVTDELMRSFERILGKNGHTFLPMSVWKEEAARILRAAANSCDFKTPCIFCDYKDTPACNEYRKTFIQGIVPHWFQEQMDEEKIALVDVVSKSSADYIKTSTGFSSGGATPHDVALFKEHIKNGKKIKAAGGISSPDDARRFLSLGADRLGTSRLVKLAKQAEENT